jgi:IclR family acetate operon transcriptional repressor
MVSKPSDGDKDSARRPRIQSVARALAILMQISNSEGLTAREVSARLGLSLSTTYHLLHTLESEGFVIKGDRRAYRLGLRIGTLADAFRRQLDPAEYLAPYVRSLASVTGEAAYVAGWHDGSIVIFSRIPGHHAVNVTDLRVGLAEDAHARASGKLLLAFTSPDARAEYLTTHPPHRRTPHTIVDPDELEREFGRIRELGYSTDLEEFTPAVCCISAPLDGGASPFVFSLSAPAERFEREFDRYLEAILDVAEKASSPVLGPLPRVQPPTTAGI